jgi:acetyltransferase-like isoleucine patch superfamily enzyme
VSFGRNVFIQFPERVEIGNGVTFGNNIEINNSRDSFLRIGDYSIIGSYSSIKVAKSGSLEIGARTRINKFNVIDCNNFIKIGDNVMTAAFCHVLDSNHGMKRYLLIRDQDKKNKETIVGDDVWIGSKVTILAGSKINNGVVIGANAVVRGELDTYGIYAGIPCKKIKERI